MLIDLTRRYKKWESLYNILEGLKDGEINKYKYHSHVIHIANTNKMVVVVLSNHRPNFLNLTIDRLDVTEIKQKIDKLQLLKAKM